MCVCVCVRCVLNSYWISRYMRVVQKCPRGVVWNVFECVGLCQTECRYFRLLFIHQPSSQRTLDVTWAKNRKPYNMHHAMCLLCLFVCVFVGFFLRISRLTVRISVSLIFNTESSNFTESNEWIQWRPKSMTIFKLSASATHKFIRAHTHTLGHLDTQKHTHTRKHSESNAISALTR